MTTFDTAKGPAIDLYHGEELLDVINALDYTAEDYAYRADFEGRYTGDDSERTEYQAAADKYSALANTLRKRAGIDTV